MVSILTGQQISFYLIRARLRQTMDLQKPDTLPRETPSTHQTTTLWRQEYFPPSA